MTVKVAITADCHQIDETGHVWTLLEEAADPHQILSGRVVVAGDDAEPFVARVVDIVRWNAVAVVHLDNLGQPEEFIAAFRHANTLPR